MRNLRMLPTPGRRAIILVTVLLSISSSPWWCTHSLSLSAPPTSKSIQKVKDSSSSSTKALSYLPKLSDDWTNAKQSLRNPKCCVVAVSGVEKHLSTLQHYFCGEDAPSDLDLRMRVRCSKTNQEVRSIAYDDCSKVYNSVMGPPSSVLTNNPPANESIRQSSDNDEMNHPCILALEELARGVASLADGPLEGQCTDVHMRVVTASNYQAIDPMFHTDKCPIRGYATLTGPGTEYMDETCLPWEYATLRTFGVNGLAGNSAKSQSLKTANELEFIVMKGDHYNAPLPNDTPSSSSSPSNMANAILGTVWSRTSACVHRSPPCISSKNGANGSSRRRVILSLDLADGMDDQEWCESSRKRGWRSGMTQRKSRLVS